MKYVKLTFQYMFRRNFWKIALVTLIPSVAIGFFISFSSTVSLLVHFFDRTDYSFSAIYGDISDMNWWGLLIALGVLVLFSCILSVITGTLQRHMRTGMFAITNIFKRINENFIACFLSLLFVFICIYLFGIFASITVSAWFKITGNAVVTLVLSIFFVIIIFLIMMTLITLFSMMNPNMICTGENVLDSIAVSVKNTRPHFFNLLFAFTMPLGILFAVQVGISFIDISIIHKIVDSLMLFIISCYYPVLVFVAYYDIFDRDREDLLPENSL